MSSNPPPLPPHQPGPPSPHVYGQPTATAPVPPGAGDPPPAPPRTRSNGPMLLVTLMVAVLALVVALAGVVLGAIALGHSDKATTLANAAGDARPEPAPATTAPVQPTPQTATTTDGTPDPGGATASPGDINPSAAFTVAYQDQHLRVQSARCGFNDQTHVDLDEPRVARNDTNTEISYADCTPGHIDTDLPLAEVTDAGATPADCLDKIRTAPTRSPVAPKAGMTLCVVTSQNDASAQGITQKLVFVTIDSIGADNGTGILSITVKAWNVPN